MTHEKVPTETKLDLMDDPDVISVGEGIRDGDDAVIITVNRLSDLGPADFPTSIHGLPVYVEYGDPVTPDVDRIVRPDATRPGRYRPVQPGTSTENVGIGVSGGTLGPLMEDDDGNLFFSSNWHVWDDFEAVSGDRIIQPMGLDGGGSGDKIAEFVDGANPDTDNIDFSYAEPVDDVGISSHVFDVGVQQGSRDPQPGDPVVKSGRTTGVTHGHVDQINVIIGQEGTDLTLHDQITCSYESDGGDSGSPVLHANTHEVMAIHWGSNGSASNIQRIEDWMGAQAVDGPVDQPDPNQDPIARLSSVNIDGLNVAVSASNASDPDGEIVSYEWDWEYNGNFVTQATGQDAEVSYTEGGSYTVALRVTDDDGATDVETHDVVVEAADQPPAASFSLETNDLQAIVHPDATDPNNDIVEYVVEWGDGSGTAQPSSVPQAHEYDEGGDYTVSLTVIDSMDLSDTVSDTVTVVDPCGDVDCPGGETCEDGDCVIDSSVPCEYEDYPRHEWGYDGSEAGDFQAWQACEITTQRFQDLTSPGEGTASLVHPSETGIGSPAGGEIVLIGLIVTGIVLAS